MWGAIHGRRFGSGICGPRVVVFVTRSVVTDSDSFAYEIGSRGLSVLPFILVLVLVGIAMGALYRSWHWWKKEETSGLQINGFIRQKTILFIFAVSTLLLILPIIIWNNIDRGALTDPWTNFVSMACYSTAYSAVLLSSFCFLQRNIFTNKGILSHFWRLQRDPLFGPEELHSSNSTRSPESSTISISIVPSQAERTPLEESSPSVEDEVSDDSSKAPQEVTQSSEKHFVSKVSDLSSANSAVSSAS